MSLSSKIILWSTLLLPYSAEAIAPDTTDPRAIMDAVESRDTGDKGTFQLQIVVTDSRDRSRTRSLVVRTMRFGEGRKQLMLFDSPADLRNAGLLSIDYDDGKKADEQWLYLPSLERTTRIASADRSSSFMGTDLSYADMTKADPDDYTYTMLDADANVDGEACWLVEARPTNDKTTQETGYAKVHTWVSKGKLVPLRSKAWVIAGKKLKYTQFGDWRQIDGVWIAYDVEVRTVRNGERLSTSKLTTSNAEFGREDIVEDDFTQQRLERGL